jgi:hypothetical protein
MWMIALVISVIVGGMVSETETVPGKKFDTEAACATFYIQNEKKVTEEANEILKEELEYHPDANRVEIAIQCIPSGQDA